MGRFIYLIKLLYLMTKSIDRPKEELTGLALGGLIGGSVAGPQGAVIGGIIGFFVGKAM